MDAKIHPRGEGNMSASHDGGGDGTGGGVPTPASAQALVAFPSATPPLSPSTPQTNQDAYPTPTDEPDDLSILDLIGVSETLKDVPPGREKSDINCFADDFYIFFGLNRMTHLQDPKIIPKVLWLTVANPDPVQGTINIPWVQVEPYDASVEGGCLMDMKCVRLRWTDVHAVNSLLVIFLAHKDEMLCAPMNPGEVEEIDKRLDPMSVETNITSFPFAVVQQSGGSEDQEVQRNNGSKRPSVSGRRSARLAAKNPEGKGPTSLALQVLAKKLRLIVDTPESASQKLGALFQQELSPSAIRAICELVKLGGGRTMLTKKQEGNGAPSSA
ncbi:hypothetical protein GUJ93_ZPchr0010g10424 [Zizania palustris]|uniref:Uncharacterized protein n=1 Tax=Zizania palustris TaxID=103762 RepID=A0A8J6BM30_ZIZPA|nr:hypothetical protein GUJ93_ZPchr0010g10424 [Zizania palustris]